MEATCYNCNKISQKRTWMTFWTDGRVKIDALVCPECAQTLKEDKP